MKTLIRNCILGMIWATAIMAVAQNPINKSHQQFVIWAEQRIIIEKDWRLLGSMNVYNVIIEESRGSNLSTEKTKRWLMESLETYEQNCKNKEKKHLGFWSRKLEDLGEVMDLLSQLGAGLLTRRTVLALFLTYDESNVPGNWGDISSKAEKQEIWITQLEINRFVQNAERNPVLLNIWEQHVDRNGYQGRVSFN